MCVNTYWMALCTYGSEIKVSACSRRALAHDTMVASCVLLMPSINS